MNTTELQKCTQCRAEKPLNEFHRRRDGYQRICKACRNQGARTDYLERGKTRKPRARRVIVKENFPALAERITKLEPRLRSIALSFAHDPLQADDIYSEMSAVILTRCGPDDPDPYLLRCGRFTAQCFVDKTLCYNLYVNDLDDSDNTGAAGLQIFEAHTIENECIEREQAAQLQAIIDTLPEENRTLITMLSIGIKQREIARRLQVSEQSLSSRLQDLRKMLSVQIPASIFLTN